MNPVLATPAMLTGHYYNTAHVEYVLYVFSYRHCFAISSYIDILSSNLSKLTWLQGCSYEEKSYNKQLVRLWQVTEKNNDFDP